MSKDYLARIDAQIANDRVSKNSSATHSALSAASFLFEKMQKELDSLKKRVEALEAEPASVMQKIKDLFGKEIIND